MIPVELSQLKPLPETEESIRQQLEQYLDQRQG